MTFELTVLDLYYKQQVHWLPPSEYACTTAAIYDFESANYAKNICYAKSHLIYPFFFSIINILIPIVKAAPLKILNCCILALE